MTHSLRIGDREPRLQIKQQRELENRLSEVSSWNYYERAELEVKIFEAQLDVLLSVHHQEGVSIDWKALAFALPPHAPSYNSINHLRQTLENFATLIESGPAQEKLQEMWTADQADYDARHAKYQERFAEWHQLRRLALRILGGDCSAYLEALQIFQPFTELSEVGSEIKFKVHDSHKILCNIMINGSDIIPKEVKSLTASEKLSVRLMPKSRSHEIYQDYACGCCLRVGREILDLLPVNYVITTIEVNSLDSSAGNIEGIPIISALLDRSTMENLNFTELDPSDSMQNFKIRGDVKISRRTGTFTPIVPLAYEDLRFPPAESDGVETLLGIIGEMQTRYRATIKKNAPRSH
jgi:hypothetical protein